MMFPYSSVSSNLMLPVSKLQMCSPYRLKHCQFSILFTTFFYRNPKIEPNCSTPFLEPVLRYCVFSVAFHGPLCSSLCSGATLYTYILLCVFASQTAFRYPSLNFHYILMHIIFYKKVKVTQSCPTL